MPPVIRTAIGEQPALPCSSSKVKVYGNYSACDVFSVDKVDVLLRVVL